MITRSDEMTAKIIDGKYSFSVKRYPQRFVTVAQPEQH
jgi:hypothetical protein